MSSEYQRNYYMQVLRERLVYDKENYELTVSPVRTSNHNIQLMFKGFYIDMDMKMILVIEGEKLVLFFDDKSKIKRADRVFNIGVKGELDRQILNQIEVITNQLKFVNYFLFDNRQYATDNNYNSVDFKINTPNDILKFSKELKPFMPTHCLDSKIIVRFMLNDDFTRFEPHFFVNSRIDGNLYSGTPEEVINHLLVAYACEPLNKKLEDLTLRDHTLLAMVKI